MENYRESRKHVFCFKHVRPLSIYEAEFSSYTSTLLMTLAKLSVWGLMRRKSFGVLIQCESHTMREEWVITKLPLF